MCWNRLVPVTLLVLGLGFKADLVTAQGVPDEFPRFVAPGQEAAMESLRQLYWLHYQPSGPLIPLWDEWMPMATLWPAMGSGDGLHTIRRRWAEALASRGINEEGYVHTHQHDGLAHAEGWPFPLWTQASGIGWQESLALLAKLVEAEIPD